MLYLGIDQHARQITISLRDNQGDVVQARQVSTQPEKVQAFFYQLAERLGDGESLVAVLEVCGFNDWLIRLLQDNRCHKVILIQPDDRKTCKTDRRDAAALSELLVGQPRPPAARQARPRPASGRPRQPDRPGEPAADHPPQGRRRGPGRASSTRSSRSSATTSSGTCRPRRSPPGRPSPGSRRWPCPRSTAWRWTTCSPTWSRPSGG
jgi:hypothetical protein